ncbi:MAG: MarR family transcriptional regulator [Chloroflexi bacterium]|nr:MarR family transcriptional regulator [Chloroflexota bacterium]
MAFLDFAHRLRLLADTAAQDHAGLTLEQAVVLCKIDLAGGEATMSQLAAALGRATHTVTARVDTLERRGLAVRNRKSSGDRRQVWVSLTPEGAKRLESYRSSRDGILESVFVGDSEEAVAQLRQLIAGMGPLLESDSYEIIQKGTASRAGGGGRAAKSLVRKAAFGWSATHRTSPSETPRLIPTSPEWRDMPGLLRMTD